MIRNKLIALTGSAIVAGVAGIALAAPATAMEAKDPQAGNGLGSTVTTTTDDSQWLEIGLGALGGLAIAGAGVAAASGLKRRSTVPTG